MSIRRIRELISGMQTWSPQEAPRLREELTEEFVALMENLDTRIHDLQLVLAAAELGPHATTLELLVRALADEFALSTSQDVGVLLGENDPIISWREMARVLAEGSDLLRLPDWVVPAFRQVTSILSGDMFPCLFARQTNYLKSGWIRFVDSIETQSGREAVREAILAYYNVLKGHPRERTIIMPLMVIVKPCYPMLSLKEYREQAWGLFQYLHDNDPCAWPIDVPTEPDRGDWSFCFGGRQLFSNVSNPAHAVHKSRNLGDSLVFAMQPRTNFDLVGGNNRKGRAVRNEIRARAERYDGSVATHLGFFGTPENREWLQMATKDSEADQDFPKVCPFHFNADKGAIGKK